MPIPHFVPNFPTLEMSLTFFSSSDDPLLPIFPLVPFVANIGANVVELFVYIINPMIGRRFEGK